MLLVLLPVADARTFALPWKHVKQITFKEVKKPIKSTSNSPYIKYRTYTKLPKVYHSNHYGQSKFLWYKGKRLKKYKRFNQIYS